MANSLKYLILSTSPRIGGNSDTAARYVETLLKAKGDGVFLNTSRKKINPCLGCNLCSRDGRCVQKDDMAEIYELLPQINYLVIASPIYAMGLCAQAKAIIDRLQPYWAQKYLLKQSEMQQKRRKGLYLLTAGTNFNTVFTGAEITLKYLNNVLEVEEFRIVGFKNLEEKGEIKKDPNNFNRILEAINQMGVS
ncbi:flavodoxin family protein [Carboxydothermus hydrogenoformans]|uniref:flavodoxin family protein n=1 Tax=Carboxydothermus hydrogenoformans TaxID=129958 RepID=UPI00030D2676|nr:flavodoxin family protein [Carboxydothermus hydrogenoformans]